MTRRTIYGKSMRILAETNGLSLSTLEHRLRLGMNIKDALAEPTRSREVTDERLAVREQVALAKLGNLPRSLE